MTHIKDAIPNERFELFIENFCRVFEIDYTSISIANSTYLSKLVPNNFERSVFAVYFGLTLKNLGLDYRTIRTHNKRFQEGEGKVFPRTLDKYMRQDMRKFVASFVRLYPEDGFYLLDFFEKGDVDNDTERDSEPTESGRWY